MNSLYSPSVLAHLHGSAGYEGGAAHTPLGCSGRSPLIYCGMQVFCSLFLKGCCQVG